MDRKVARALRATRPNRQDGGFVADTEELQQRAAADPHRYERFLEPVAKGVNWLKGVVQEPFNMARDAREAGGYSKLDPNDVGRAGLNTGLATLAPAAGLGNLPRGAEYVLMSGAGPTDKKGIRAYHGSPHDFDTFDMSKIGTGEGAQAYGHGLYFAESEGVARYYRDALTRHTGTSNLRTTYFDGIIDGSNNATHAYLARILRSHNGDVEKTKLTVADHLAQRPNDPDFMRANKILNDPNLNLAITDKNPGRMYEVNIKADPEDFLDWDKPLSQQSEAVRGALNNEAIPPIRAMLGGMRGKRFSDQQVQPYFKGADIIDDIGSDRIAASKLLREAGIPGIKYLDAGSRGAGDGSRNYVLFRDDIIDIVRKYGMAAAVSMYGADAVTQAMGQE